MRRMRGIGTRCRSAPTMIHAESSAADDFADAGDEAQSRIEPDAFLRPRNGNRLVHEVGEAAKRDEIRRQFLVRLDDLGDDGAGMLSGNASACRLSS